MTNADEGDKREHTHSPSPNTDYLTSTLPAELVGRVHIKTNTMRMLTMNLPTKEQLMSEMNNDERSPKTELVCTEGPKAHPVDGGNKKTTLTSTSPYKNQTRFDGHPTAAIEEYESFHHDWDSFFQCLVQYKEKYGNTNVPTHFYEDPELSTWCDYQRFMWTREHPSTGTEGELMVNDETPSTTIQKYLTPSRKKRLDNLGFVWYVPTNRPHIHSHVAPLEQHTGTPTKKDSDKALLIDRAGRTSYDDQWDAMFEALVAYKKQHGHCLVPKRYKDDPKLGTWVDTQRVQYKKMKKSMETSSPQPSPVSSHSTSRQNRRITMQRIQRLEQIGFVWSIRDDWQKHYEELKDYKKEFGHCNVPARYTKNRRLGIWVSAQRQYYKLRNETSIRQSSPLTPERIDLLNELEFLWKVRCRDSPVPDEWDTRLLELVEFKRRYGHCRVPTQDPSHATLANWLSTLRKKYVHYVNDKKQGSVSCCSSTCLSDDRVRTLQTMGFDFTPDALEVALCQSRGQETTSQSSAQVFHQRKDSSESGDQYSRMTAI